VVDRGAPDARDLFDVSGAALASLDLDRGDAERHQLRQHRERVQAGRLLERIVADSVDVETPLAQRRVAARLVGRVAVDQDFVQARANAVGAVLPAHCRRRRADAGGIRRLAGCVRRQRAAPFDHHAQATETEHLDLGTRVAADVSDLRQRQHARQHCPLDAIAFAVELDRLVGGRRSLHRQVQAQLRVVVARVGEHCGIGADQCIGAEPGGDVHGAPPARRLARVGERVQRHQHLCAARVGIRDAVARLLEVEVQPREVARVGGVLQPHVDGVGASVDGEPERA